jgi:hypothetical protein
MPFLLSLRRKEIAISVPQIWRKNHGHCSAVFGYVSISKEADIKLQILLGNTPFCMAAKVRVLQKMKKKDLE